MSLYPPGRGDPCQVANLAQPSCNRNTHNATIRNGMMAEGEPRSGRVATHTRILNDTRRHGRGRPWSRTRTCAKGSTGCSRSDSREVVDRGLDDDVPDGLRERRSSVFGESPGKPVRLPFGMRRDDDLVGGKDAEDVPYR